MRFENTCPKSEVSPSIQMEDPKTTFDDFATQRQHIVGTKHDIDNRASALTTTRCLLYLPKTLVHKQLKNGPPFYPLRKFCFLLHCQASQTGISKRNSTNLRVKALGSRRVSYIVTKLLHCFISHVSTSKIISKLFQPLKLFQNNLSDIEHVGKYS